ncbi:uncharacterized protein LOC123322677 [Coccinella septempunctata]|uniref:uncharacterized protein LOC123322677 n=1 Tax=Coccinella septempunctata TaxID=41139 RepID=UPI001D085CC1|nr:uncharacterized protein LOC123322677 [Coccinella septempunctata]
MFGVIILIFILLILLYFLAIKPFRYWRVREVKTGKEIPLFGENFGIVFGLESFVDQTKRIYNLYPNERYYGIYQFSTPALVLRTPDIIKKMCVKDFDYFLNRQNFAAEGDVLFSKNLVGLKGQSWKDMRSAISPTFTSSKMKSMFVMVCQNAKLFVDNFLEKDEEITEVEFKDAVSRFTSDVIASTAFGIQVDSLKDRNNTFFKMGREGINFGSLRIKIAFCLYQLSPKIASILGIPIIATKVQDFIINLVRDTLKMREERNIKRPDVLGLLLDARRGLMSTKETEEENDGFAVVKEHLEMKGINCDLTDVDIAAQAFVFFLAGFEGVATLLCLTAYELAINPDIQRKLMDEIDENWPENNEPSYNKVMNMTYMDMVVSEALRKWPNGIMTDRVVTKEYTIQPELPGEKPVTLEEGTVLIIPILGIHFDPKYYPNPEKFDPERFSPENRHKIDPYTYIPFGVGPRNCIGSRFALMEVKALLFYLLHHFELVPIEKTQIPIKLNKNGFGFVPENGCHVGLKKRCEWIISILRNIEFLDPSKLIRLVCLAHQILKSRKVLQMFGLIILLSILLILLYYVAVKPYSYWKDRGVKTGKVIPFFGDNFRVVFGLEGFVDQTKRIYNSFPNERYYGIYQFSKPALVLRTPGIIKKMCVKDFDYFPNRQNFATQGDVLFSKNLLGLKGQAWKDMRSAISPTFTSARIKSMFVLVCQNAKLFIDNFLKKDEDITEVEFKDVISRFTSDVVANAAFGIQVDSLKDRNNMFYKMVRHGVNLGSIRIKIAFCLYKLSPKIASIFGIPLLERKVEDFILNLVENTLKIREEKNIRRPDILGLLLDARRGLLSTKEPEEENNEGFSIVKEHLEMKTIDCDLSDVDIAAQAFVFFIAGFEGVATLLCITVYELAINPEVQRKLIDEIDENWPENNEPSYNKVMSMTYLDMVVSEILRKWPNGIITDRIVTREYTIEPELPGEKPVTLEEGTLILIPILGIHSDPKYYPNPEKFDPERFSPENRHKIDPYTYIPFGVGPRNCIGSRFALMEIKALLFYLLRHFELIPVEKTQIPVKISKNAFNIIPEDGLYVGLKRR